MNENLILKFEDFSSKENEVTGEMMGGRYEYEIPVDGLKPGIIAWPQHSYHHPDHYVDVLAVEKGVVKVKVGHFNGNMDGPFEITLEKEASYSYYFGEWLYGYNVALEKADDEKIKKLRQEFRTRR